jgi:hypothetical protein
MPYELIESESAQAFLTLRRRQIQPSWNCFEPCSSAVLSLGMYLMMRMMTTQKSGKAKDEDN